jgi:hypothetical protein
VGAGLGAGVSAGVGVSAVKICFKNPVLIAPCVGRAANDKHRTEKMEGVAVSELILECSYIFNHLWL